MTCGIRNDLENPTEDGYCKNGHDNWLEYRDVMGVEGGDENKIIVKKAARRFKLSVAELKKKFLDPSIKQL